MMAQEKQPQEYVSIIGFSYLDPIVRLIEELESLGSKGPNEVQASSIENGYSASVVILTVLLLESAIARTQYIQGNKPANKPLDFVCAIYPNSGFVDALEELFVVRDVIAHNHVWEAQYLWDDQVGLRLVSAALESGYGDKKFRRVIDQTNRKTRYLGINLFPTRICREDARVVLRTVVEFLLFLENEDRRYVYISNQYVKQGENLVRFVDLVANLGQSSSGVVSRWRKAA
jgi:hypothetical protein